MSDTLDPRIQLECARTLYRSGAVSFLAAMGVTVYMMVTLWPYAPHPLMMLWLGLQLVTQLFRALLLLGFRRANPGADRARVWMRRYAGYMAVAGLVWGSTAFLFFQPETPIAQALVMCGLYGISGGSVPGNAYYPPTIYAFVGLIFGAVMLRMVQIGDSGHIALGIASVFFAGMMILFCRVQNRSQIEGFKIRFENVELLEQLRVRTNEAEAARRRAEQANLAKSQFLAAASHDLRQPLHALGLFSASLETLNLDAAGKAVVARIQDSVHALESLFDALLDISRLDAGVLQAKPEPVAVAPMFERLRRVFQPLAAQAGLTLRFASCPATVMTDPAMLEQILGNLIGNAIRHTRRGRVVVGCRRAADGWVRFEVWDTGLGIGAGDAVRIFDEFVQLGNPERDRRKGLGLGLAIAQRLAALLRTEITLSSVPGKGSVFRLETPCSTAAPAALLDAPSADLDFLAGRRALLIDDEEAIREGFRLLLGKWGMSIDTASDLTEAEALLATGRYDVLLADYRLKDGANGVAVIQAIRAAQTPPPAAALITGDMGAPLLAEARDLGLPLLHKPVRPAKLRAVLVHLLSQ